MRSYPWGMAEALSSSHSDVPALKRLLIELSFDNIKVPAPFLSMPQANVILNLNEMGFCLCWVLCQSSLRT